MFRFQGSKLSEDIWKYLFLRTLCTHLCFDDCREYLYTRYSNSLAVFRSKTVIKIRNNTTEDVGGSIDSHPIIENERNEKLNMDDIHKKN